MKRLSQACKNIAETLHLPGWNDPKTNPIELFRNYLLKDGSEGKLVVLDNIDDITMLEEDLNFQDRSVKFADLIPRVAPIKVLLTSRDRRVGERLAARGSTITVQTMVIPESIQLLNSYLSQEQKILPSEKEELVKSLDYLPLAITQAAAYITEDCISVGEYLSMLKESDDQLEELLSESLSDDRRGHQDGNSPIKTWKISFDHIVKIDRRASEILLLMAFYDRNHIQFSLLQQKTESKPRFLKAAATLECFSLISRIPGYDAYKMHRLVQVATQAWSRTQEFALKVRLEAITILSRGFPSGEYETWRECEDLLPHTRVIMSRSYESDDTRLQYANLLTKVAWFYRCQGLYNDGISIALEAHNIFQDVKGPNDPGAHSNMITKIDCQMQLFDFASIKSAIDALKEIHASLETNLGPEDPETLRALGNLGWGLYLRDNLQGIIPEEAILLLRKVLRLREQVLGTEHPKTMTTMNNLGLALESRRELIEESNPDILDERDDVGSREALDEAGAESLKLLTECLSRCEQRLGLEHPNTLETQRNLGDFLLVRGAYTEAEKLLRSCIASRVALFGPYHVDIIPTLSALARCLSECDSGEEAIKIGRETIAIAEGVLGPDHRETLVNRMNLASNLRKAGHYTQAVQHYQLVLDARTAEDGGIWFDLGEIQDAASRCLVYLVLTRWPTRPRQKIKISQEILLRKVIRKETSGWKREDLDDIQILRLLAYASKDTVKNLDPLPEGWEIRLSNSNEVYFANKRSRSTTWLDPRTPLSKEVELADPPSFETEHIAPSRDLYSAVLPKDEPRSTNGSSTSSVFEESEIDTDADDGKV